MKKRLCILILIAAVTFGTTISAQSWKVDRAHSSILFNVKHSGISFVNGRFEEFEGMVSGGASEFSNASVSFTAQVKSINTGVDGRDNHLRSADFFDAENHPELTFESKSFTKSGSNTYKVTGDMTMRGNTKEVTLVVEHIGTIDTRNGGKKAGFRITGTVNRFDFGVGGAKGSVAPDVEIICNVEMALQK